MRPCSALYSENKSSHHHVRSPLLANLYVSRVPSPPELGKLILTDLSQIVLNRMLNFVKKTRLNKTKLVWEVDYYIIQIHDV